MFCPSNILYYTVAESTKSKAEHVAIYCEEYCNSCLHRKCTGLSKLLFTRMKSLQTLSIAFIANSKTIAEIAILKSTIASLTQNVSTL